MEPKFEYARKVRIKVRKAYLKDSLFGIQRVIVDTGYGEQPMIFVPGQGWRCGIDERHQKLIMLPGEVDYHDWWDGWWNTNWKYQDWAWCYMFKDGFSKAR